MKDQSHRVIRRLCGKPGTLVAAGVLAMACTGFGCGAFQPPLEVVEFVDLERYTGKWYEIARYPNLFEQNCVAPTAEYTIREDGDIDVVNTCRKFTLDGDLDVIEGIARVVDSQTNAKLKVRFFGPFEGDYWIIDLDSEYNYAVVGAPNRRFLWILSRTPTMDPQVYDQIIAGLPDLGYDPNRLLRTTQIDSNP